MTIQLGKRIRRRVRRGVPRSVAERWERVKLLRSVRSNYNYDHERFLEHSGIGGDLVDRVQFEAWLTKEHHRVEKRLAFNKPRPGFAADVIRRLADNVERYIRQHGVDNTVRRVAVSLREYNEFNRQHGIRGVVLGAATCDVAEETASERATRQTGRQAILRGGKLDLQAFFTSRHSIRDFAPGEIPRCTLEQAVRMAQWTPSVCNRQSARVYIVEDPEHQKRVLDLQGGAKGFGHTANKIIVVTSDLRCFFSVGERNQSWVDGGMFAMSLVYALHSLGLGTCCLNWCKESQIDLALRDLIPIGESEVVIMLIAVGNIPESLRVAASERKPLGDVLAFV